MVRQDLFVPPAATEGGEPKADAVFRMIDGSPLTTGNLVSGQTIELNCMRGPK